MSHLPPLLRDQRKVDAEHLKLLSIFHFVVAGLAIFGLGFLFLHYFMMSQVMVNAGAWKHQHPNDPNPAEFMGVFKWFYLVLGVLVVVGGVGNVLSGFFIRQRKHRIFSLIVAALNCLHMPVGLALGIFTFIIMLRPSVQEVYDAEAGILPATTGGGPPPVPPGEQATRMPVAGAAPLAVVAAPPLLPAAPQGDATGGLIPYKNPQALMAYYAGVFCIIPGFGFFIAIAAVWLGIVGLRRRKLQPVIRGSVHAWFGIIAGTISISAHLFLVFLIARISRH